MLHPYVVGVTDGTMYEDGLEIATWPLGDFGAMNEAIDYLLTHPDETQTMARNGQRRTLADHTYTRRMETLMKIVSEL